MNELIIAGSITSALTHFAVLGVAGIVERHNEVEASVCWIDEPEPQACVLTELDQVDIAQRIKEHASRHTDPTSWVQRRVESGPRAGVGLFTARVRPPGADEWADYLRDRELARDAAAFDSIDARIQLALGEPAWWRVTKTESRPDDGASRWEMKTRNRGQEFLVDRLAPLAVAVASRSAERVLAGLVGEIRDDETGKNSPESRTATGLAMPGPTDSVLAWCALWGLHVAPTVMRFAGVAQSPGVWRRDVVHPRIALLPAFVQPVSTRRFSEVLTSRQFDFAGPRASATDEDRIAEARSWLREQGVRALIRFPIRKGGSSSAPERQLLAGQVDVL